VFFKWEANERIHTHEGRLSISPQQKGLMERGGEEKRREVKRKKGFLQIGQTRQFVENCGGEGAKVVGV
jgi:hypothetical protein